MLAIQSNTARYHCLYTQGAVAFRASGVFFLTHLVVEIFYSCCNSKFIDKFINAFSGIMGNESKFSSFRSIERIRQQHFKHLTLKFYKDWSPVP